MSESAARAENFIFAMTSTEVKQCAQKLQYVHPRRPKISVEKKYSMHTRYSTVYAYTRTVCDTQYAQFGGAYLGTGV